MYTIIFHLKALKKLPTRDFWFENICTILQPCRQPFFKNEKKNSRFFLVGYSFVVIAQASPPHLSIQSSSGWISLERRDPSVT
jgi:hypothetical protein